MKKLYTRYPVFWLCFLTLAICFGVTLLAAWPGFFCYDAETEVYQVFTFKYSNHHPIVHELILGNAIRVGYKIFGTYSAGIAGYCIVQGLILAAIFAYMMSVISSFGASRIFVIAGTLFLGLFPPISMFAVCTTKDGLFCGGVVLFCTRLFQIIRRPEQEKTPGGVLLSFLAVCLILFFRNNGLYVLIVFAVLTFLFYRERKRTLLVVITGVLFYLAVTEILIAKLPATRGEMKEMFSVPMQQLARVHADDREAYGQEDLEILYTLIPEVILENYNPDCADPVKVNFLEDNFKSDPGKYVSLWWRTFLKRPGLYAAAFWDLIDAYVVPGTVITGYEGNKVGEMVYGESAYFQFSPDTPAQMHPVFRALNGIYREISLNADVQRLPVIGVLLSPATWLWICFGTLLLAGAFRKKEGVLLHLVPLLTFLTVLLGPIALVRYVLYAAELLPLYLYDVFGEGKGYGKNKA